jgi:hypothetical protein
VGLGTKSKRYTFFEMIMQTQFFNGEKYVKCVLHSSNEVIVTQFSKQ